jgi:hypothetical protein
MTTDDVFHEWINKQPKVNWKDAKEVKKLIIIWGDYVKDKYLAEQLILHGVSNSVFCEDCKHTHYVRLKRNPNRCLDCGGKR